MKATARVALAIVTAVAILVVGPQPASAALPWVALDLNVPIASDPNVVYDATGYGFKIFYRGANGHLWYVPDGAGYGWVGSPVDLGGAYPISAPWAERYQQGYRVFYRGSNGHLWYAPYDGGLWWGAPVDLGGAYPTGTPSAAMPGGATIKVLYRGPNAHLFLSEYDGGQWWGPAWDLGGVNLTSDPAAIVPYGAPASLRAFYRGPNGTLWMSPYDGGQWWGAPVDLGGPTLGSAPAGYSYSGGYFLAYGDVNGYLVTRWCNAALACQAAEGTGIRMAGAPTAKSENQIFYRGTNGHLWVAFVTTL